MDKKNISVPDQETIPAQLVAKILNEINSLRADITAKDQLLAQYEATPLEVIPVEELDKVVKVEVKEPQAYMDEASEIKRSIKSLCSMYGSLSENERKYKALAEEYKAKLEAPAPTRWTRVKDTLGRWFSLDHVVIWVICLDLVAVAALTATTFYAVRWSDDAWARRAYVAASCSPDVKDPGLYYQYVRRLFKEEKRSTAKGVVLDFEARVRKETEEKEVQDEPVR